MLACVSSRGRTGVLVKVLYVVLLGSIVLSRAPGDSMCKGTLSKFEVITLGQKIVSIKAHSEVEGPLYHVIWWASPRQHVEIGRAHV